METIKSYTDLEQSKKLAKILPLESADMCYRIVAYNPNNTHEYQPYCFSGTLSSDIPCWSLAALLGVIPQEIFDGEYIINITEGCDYKWVLTYDHCENRKISYYGLSTGADNLIDACYDHCENRKISYYGLSTGADNLIDACFEMIIKLNEHKML